MGRPLILKFDVDDKGTPKLKYISNEFGNLRGAFERTAQEQLRFNTLQGRVEQQLNRLGAGARGVLGAWPGVHFLIRDLGVLTGAMGKLFLMGGEAEVMRRKFNTVFGDMADDARRWTESFAESVGRSRYTMMGEYAKLQDLLYPMGMSRREAAVMGGRMLERAEDISVFQGRATEEVVQAMMQGLIGNARALRQYGIVISDTTLKQEALSRGYRQNINELSEIEKAQLRFNLIMKGSADSMDFAKTNADLYTQQLRSAKDLLKDFWTDVGGDVEGIGIGFLQALIGDLENPRRRMEMRIAVVGLIHDVMTGAGNVFEAVAPVLDLGTTMINELLQQFNALPDWVRSYGLIGAVLFGKDAVRLGAKGLAAAGPYGLLGAAAAVVGGPIGTWAGTPNYERQIRQKEQEIAGLERMLGQTIGGYPGQAGVAPGVIHRAEREGLLTGRLAQARQELNELRGAWEEWQGQEERIAETSQVKLFTGVSGRMSEALEGSRQTFESQLDAMWQSLETKTSDGVASFLADIDYGAGWQAALQTENALYDQRLAAEERLSAMQKQQEITQLNLRMGRTDELTLLYEERDARLSALTAARDHLTAQLARLGLEEQSEDRLARINDLLEKRAEIEGELPMLQRLYALREELILQQQIEQSLARERKIRQEIEREQWHSQALESQLSRDYMGYFGMNIPYGAEGALTQGAFSIWEDMRRYEDIQLSINQAITERNNLLIQEQDNLERVIEIERQIAMLREQSERFDMAKPMIQTAAVLDGVAQTFWGLTEAATTFFGQGSAQAKAFARLSIIVGTASSIVNTINAWTAFAALVKQPWLIGLGYAQAGMIAALGGAQLAQVGSASSRYHDGGMVTAGGKREVPIIAEEGEVFLGRKASEALLKGAARGSEAPVVVGVYFDEDSLADFFDSHRGRKVLARAGRK